MNSNNTIKKTFLFQLNHPAHYHLFKNVMHLLRLRGYNVRISIKDKDILKELVENEKYYLISNNYRKQNLYAIIKSVIDRDFCFYRLLKNLKPDVMIGTSPEIGHVRRFVNSYSIFFGEDDVNLSKTMFLGAMTCYPFFDNIVSPEGCNNSIWNRKTIFYKGFQKLAYLHPNQFSPDRSKVDVPDKVRFFLLRFANLSAYHDLNATGINNTIATKLINYLKSYGKVIISSERKLPVELEEYRFKGKLEDIHHYMFYADLYIGDSQSMAVEAAMLGTPSIRFNDFAGKISILEELENIYGLTYGFQTTEPDKMFVKVGELINKLTLKEEFALRRKKMLSDKIDVTAFMFWFIENYPESARIMKENPDYQYNFK